VDANLVPFSVASVLRRILDAQITAGEHRNYPANTAGEIEEE
jgi:hypothetical protein